MNPFGLMIFAVMAGNIPEEPTGSSRNFLFDFPIPTCVWRIATYCQAQQFAHTREAPKSICGTESGRIKWGGRSKSPRSGGVDRGASHARATAKFAILGQGGNLWIDPSCASSSGRSTAFYRTRKQPARDLLGRDREGRVQHQAVGLAPAHRLPLKKTKTRISRSRTRG